MVDNIEYAGYQASTPIDWSKLTGGLIDTIQGIGESREKQRQELEKLKTDNTKILQNAELGKSQNLNQLILAGSNDGRSMMQEWNRQLKSGQIKPIEYKNRINNLMDSWSTFANTAKSFDQQLQESMKRQQANENGKIEGSGLEEELNLRKAQLGDLRNKKVQVDPVTGNFVIGQLNNEGIFDPSSIIDVRALAKPGNMIDNRLDLTTIVDSGTKGWEDWTIETGNKTVTDALQNPAIQRARLDLANGILSNPRSVTSVLKDNSSGNYGFYYSEQDLSDKLSDRISKENELNKQLGKASLSGEALDKFIESEKNKFILLRQDDQGVYQPELTKDQYESAKKTVLDAIDARLVKKVELDEPNYGGSRSDAKDQAKQADENATMLAGYKATLRAFGADPDATISSGNWVKSSEGPNFGGLKAGYSYEKPDAKDGRKGIVVRKGREEIFFAKTPKDLAQFVYNSEPAKASLKWEDARKLVKGNSVKSTTNDPLGLGL
jgi:hypothetical protein